MTLDYEQARNFRRSETMTADDYEAHVVLKNTGDDIWKSMQSCRGRPDWSSDMGDFWDGA